MLALIVALIGGFCCYRHWQNEQLINRQVTSSVTTDTTRDTLKKTPIKPFTRQQFLNYRRQAFDRNVDKYPNGYLVIKRPGIRLPIYDRTNNWTLALGVGKSYYLDSQMGQGNYVVAGHNMGMSGVLLSNLYQVQRGDKMTISDSKYIYQYQVKTKSKVSPSVTLINGKAIAGSAYYMPKADEKPLLTVYTCSDGGADRLVVQGELIGQQRK
ncbi:class A sortase [Lactiplantibacillus plantarum]|nr:class A sortase [Lactiplantibacillus plantarum]MBS0943791.1 class A sortase [Lactiplantibacillus plantarum]